MRFVTSRSLALLQATAVTALLGAGGTACSSHAEHSQSSPSLGTSSSAILSGGAGRIPYTYDSTEAFEGAAPIFWDVRRATFGSSQDLAAGYMPPMTRLSGTQQTDGQAVAVMEMTPCDASGYQLLMSSDRMADSQTIAFKCAAGVVAGLPLYGNSSLVIVPSTGLPYPQLWDTQGSTLYTFANANDGNYQLTEIDFIDPSGTYPLATYTYSGGTLSAAVQRHYFESGNAVTFSTDQWAFTTTAGLASFNFTTYAGEQFVETTAIVNDSGQCFVQSAIKKNGSVVAGGYYLSNTTTGVPYGGGCVGQPMRFAYGDMLRGAGTTIEDVLPTSLGNNSATEFLSLTDDVVVSPFGSYVAVVDKNAPSAREYQSGAPGSFLGTQVPFVIASIAAPPTTTTISYVDVTCGGNNYCNSLPSTFLTDDGSSTNLQYSTGQNTVSTVVNSTNNGSGVIYAGSWVYDNLNRVQIARQTMQAGAAGAPAVIGNTLTTYSSASPGAYVQSVNTTSGGGLNSVTTHTHSGSGSLFVDTYTNSLSGNVIPFTVTSLPDGQPVSDTTNGAAGLAHSYSWDSVGRALGATTTQYGSAVLDTTSVQYGTAHPEIPTAFFRTTGGVALVDALTLDGPTGRVTDDRQWAGSLGWWITDHTAAYSETVASNHIYDQVATTETFDEYGQNSSFLTATEGGNDDVGEEVDACGQRRDCASNLGQAGVCFPVTVVVTPE